MRLLPAVLSMLASGLYHGPAVLLHLLRIMVGWTPSAATSKLARAPKGPPKVRVESKDFEMLSGLRGLAALTVLFRHIEVGKYLGGYGGLVELGVFMVATFFVLSSFLLSFRALRDDIPLWGHPRAQYGLKQWILSTQSSTSQTAVPVFCRVRHIALEALRSTQYWMKYLVRRFFRVWPLYAFIVVCAHIWPGEISSRLYGAFGGSIWTSFLLQDRLLGHEMAQFWSLRPEFCYYLLIPLYISTWKTAEMLDNVHVIAPNGSPEESERPTIFTQRYAWKSVHWRLAHFTISLVICLGQAAFNPLRNSAHQEQHIGPYIPVFWAGTAGAMVLHVLLQKGWTVNPHNLSKYSRGFLSYRMIGDVLAGLIVAGVVASDDWYYTLITGHPQEDRWWSWGPRTHPDGSLIGPVAMCWAGLLVVVFILFIVLLAPRGTSASVLSGPVLVRAGDISFSIYSVHPVVDSWMRSHIIPSTLSGFDQLILILIGIWVTAELTYRFVEMPFMRLGNALCRKIDDHARHLELILERPHHQVPSDEMEVGLLQVDKEVA